MGELRNMLPHTERRPMGYRVEAENDAGRGGIRRRFTGGEIEDHIEAAFEAVKLAFVCAAGILGGALFVLAFWG